VRDRAGACGPVDDIVLVEVFEGEGEFCDVETSALLGEASLALEMPKELTSTLEVRNKIELGVSLEAKLEADEERRVEGTLKDLALTNGVCNFLLGDDLLFRQDLHGVYTPCVDFADLEDFAKGADANELEEFKISRGERSAGLRSGEGGEREGGRGEMQTLYCSKETWMRTSPETGSFPMG